MNRSRQGLEGLAEIRWGTVGRVFDHDLTSFDHESWETEQIAAYPDAKDITNKKLKQFW